jgi:hypothetical protein
LLKNFSLSPKSSFIANCEQQTQNIFVKAPLRGAFTKNLDLVCSQSAVMIDSKLSKFGDRSAKATSIYIVYIRYHFLVWRST